MNRANPRRLARLFGRRLRAWALHAAWPALAMGCVHSDGWLPPPEPKPDAVRPAPAPPPEDHTTAAPTAVTVPQVAEKVLPIDLDAVLHLAEEQNTQVGLSRERLHESEAEKDLADLSWLPNILAGVAYYRHEGGIQNEDGTLTRSSTAALYPGLDVSARLDLRASVYARINAERKVWQQKGELSRVTSETLLDAANTYLDLLAARTGEAIVRRIEGYQQEVLKWAEALARDEPSAAIQVETIRAQASGRRQALVQLRQQGDAAAVKLAYLLGLGPNVQLVPADTALRPIELVDATQPTGALVERALQAGPGVRELEQVLAIIHSGIDRAKGPGRLLPVVELRTLEGGFGAGPNSTLDWANRFDLGLQARWNLTDLFTASSRSRVASSKLRQAHLSYEDLRGKLALGVQEAQQTVQSSRTQIRLGGDQVGYASRTYKLSNLRLTEKVMGSSTTEVMSALQVLELAHLNSLNAIRAHNKAQVRLMVLLGAGSDGVPVCGKPVK